MIAIDADSCISFSNMGLFVGGDDWMHPEISTPTHELVFVIKGSIFIEEAGTKFALSRGDMLLLNAGAVHKGYEKSDGASFFWLHFFAENPERFCVKHARITDVYNCVSFFSRLNHLAKTGADKALVESMLLAFLLEKKSLAAEKNKLFHDVREFIRINVAAAPKVKDVAGKFGYNPDYLSRVFTANCGLPLKKFIDKERLNFICGLLQTTTLTLKEIAAKASFEDENALIKFFGNRCGCTPTHFRNRCYDSHLNNS